jgi:hypothetical protein
VPNPNITIRNFFIAVRRRSLSLLEVRSRRRRFRVVSKSRGSQGRIVPRDDSTRLRDQWAYLSCRRPLLPPPPLRLCQVGAGRHAVLHHARRRQALRPRGLRQERARQEPVLHHARRRQALRAPGVRASGARHHGVLHHARWRYATPPSPHDDTRAPLPSRCSQGTRLKRNPTGPVSTSPTASPHPLCVARGHAPSASASAAVPLAIEIRFMKSPGSTLNDAERVV